MSQLWTGPVIASVWITVSDCLPGGSHEPSEFQHPRPAAQARLPQFTQQSRAVIRASGFLDSGFGCVCGGRRVRRDLVRVL